MFKKLLLLALAPLFLWPFGLIAQELHNDYKGTLRGEVVEVLEEGERLIPGTETNYPYQIIRAKILDGERQGEEVTIENDYLLLDLGDKFFFNYLVDINGQELYAVTNIDRRAPLIILAIIFVAVVIAFGGWQGVRSLIALAGSFFAIFYILIPGLLNGWNPLFASFLVAGGVLFAAIFFTHGFNRESTVAFGGTMLSVLITAILAILAVNFAELSGFASDESIYLNFNTSGTLDFRGLLLGAIIIGVLGVLDDIAVTQAAVVGELYSSNKEMGRREVYKKALRVGREHVGALVNTLVLAYTGVSLPLLLLFQFSPSSFDSVLNMEIFATEIVRTIVGSIGLILTVPIVTLLAVIFLKGHESQHHSHHHFHGH